MSFLSIFRSTIFRQCRNTPFMKNLQCQNFHILSRITGTNTNLENASNNKLLDLKSNSGIEQNRGIKIKGHLDKRCKDCYILISGGRVQVKCPTHPRHKQWGFKKKEKYTQILTHACQSKFRPY